MPRNHIEQPGLRLRMGREGTRISSQHRQLDTLYGMLAAAMERGSETRARRAFERFADAFDAHISLEDSLYFPAVRSLYEVAGEELDGLHREHEGFRRELEALGELFEAGNLSACEGPLDRFVAGVARHEALEEDLMDRLVAPREIPDR
jgi:hemerythrin-like domain-containing protein